LAYEINGDYEHGLEDYAAAARLDPKKFGGIDLDPRYAPALTKRGDGYLAKDELNAAIADYDHAIKLDVTLMAPLSGRGRAYLAKKDYNQAAEDFSRILKREPRNADAYRGRLVAFDALGNLDAAVQDLQQVSLLDPTGDYSQLRSKYTAQLV